MPTLVIPKTYRDGRPPRVIDLDNIRLTLETFFNTTKLDAANISLAAISSAITATQAKTIIDSSEIGQTVELINTASAPTATVVDTGYYLVYIQANMSLEVGSSGTTTTYISESSTITLSINGVSSYSRTLTAEFTIRAGGGGFDTITYGHVGGISLFRSLTLGDELSLNVPGSITLIKLYET